MFVSDCFWRRLLTGSVLAVALMVVPEGTVSGQSLWTTPYQTNQAAVEWVVPTLEDRTFSVSGGAAYLDLSFAVTRYLEVVGEFPFAYAGSASTVGNPYLGIGLSGTSFPVLLELGVRLPVTSDNPALDVGRLANFGRTNAFRPQERNASALASWRYVVSRQLNVRLRGGVVLAQFPEGTPNAGRQTRLHYAGQVWYRRNPFMAGVTVSGQVPPVKPGELRAESVNHVAAIIMLNLQSVQPGLLVGVPVDQELRNAVPLRIGLTLSTTYRR